MCPGWNCVHEAGIRVRELGDAQSAGQQGWKGWKGAESGVQKAIPTKDTKVECCLLFLQEMWEPLPDPAL